MKNIDILIMEDNLASIIKLTDLFGINQITAPSKDYQVVQIKDLFGIRGNLHICQTSNAARKLLTDKDISFTMAFLDILIPANQGETDAPINTKEILRLPDISKKILHLFIMSVSKVELNDFNKSFNLNIYSVMYVFKEWLDEKFYLHLLSNYFENQLNSIISKIFINNGYFEGIRHISSIYNDLNKGKDVVIESEFNLTKSEKFKINVFTEYSPLQYVMVHKPGDEIKRVLPENAEELLFDQPVDYNKFFKQYSVFSSILEEYLKLNEGKPYYIEKLLKEILEKGVYYKCLLILFLIQKVPSLSIQQFLQFSSMSVDDIIELAVVGTLGDKKYLSPIPNFIFTRDNMISIGNKIFLPPMTKDARKRESLLIEYVLKNHDDFGNQVLAEDFNSLLAEEDVFEGGDFLLIDKETIFIGISDRTTLGSVRKFANYIFKKISSFKTIVGIEARLIHDRSMHLDTYMGVLKDYILLLDEPLISSSNNTFFVFENNANKNTKNASKSAIEEYPEKIILGNFYDLLKNLNIHQEVIKVDEKREAFDDACNVLTLNNNNILTYDRGVNTLKILGEKGFKKINYLANQSSKWEIFTLINENWVSEKRSDTLESIFNDSDNYIFEIEGSELILARGGCHCMSMPLLRM